MYQPRGPPRRPYPAYGAYRGPPRGAYGQPYNPYYQGQVRPYQGGAGPAHPRHPYLDLLGVQSKFYFSEVDRCLLQVCQRHPRRQVGQDLLALKCHYAGQTLEELGIPLNVHVSFNLKNSDTTPVPEPVATKAVEKDGVKTRYFAKVILFGGTGPEDEKFKGKTHLSKRLNFLLARKEHGTVAPIGGEWSAEKDGAAPSDANLKKTAIRVTKDLIGVDLSKCDTWLKFLEFHYKKEEGNTVTVFFIPNVWEHFPEGISPSTQAREETKEVKEEVEEEVEDPEDPEKKQKVKKEVTTTKVVKVVEWRPYEVSLHSLLEYDCTRPSPDDVVEFCIFADCFNEVLQRDFGLQVLDILRQKKDENEQQENEKKRKREEEEAAEAEKKAKLENGEAKEVEKVEEKKEEAPKPKVKLQHNVNQEMLVPFQFFDKQPHTGIISGSLRREVLEGVFHQYGTLTKAEIDDLLLKGAGLRPSAGAYNSPPSILYYVKLATTTVEVPVEEEKPEEKAEEKAEEKKEEGAAEAVAEAQEEATEVTAEDATMEEPEAAEEAAAEDGAMTETSLNKLLLKDLRTMCQEKGLSQTGKKADLIERLLKGA
eukprot:EG_transcript_6674